MKALKINEIARAVHAIDYDSTSRDREIVQVEFDSRKNEENSLFVPLKGERDGHEFAKQAMENGAIAALWSNDPSTAPQGLILIQVEDTLQALQDLASYYLTLIHPKVIGITGSAGKTTTKDMTAAAVGSAYKVYKTQGNYNNEIGVPYTILHAPEETEVLVLEMGMSGRGEISLLTSIAHPDIAVITMIGESHLELLGSRENIAKAKMEILEGLKEGGTFIYPGDEPLIAERLRPNLPFKTLRVGLGGDEDIYALSMENEQYQATFTTNLSPNVKVTLPVSGDHNIKNALMACAVAYSLGIPLEKVQSELAHFELSANRSRWIEGENETQILDDTYNANPSATRAVLKTFRHAKGEGRQLLVFGDMLELGKESPNLHAGLASDIIQQEVDSVWLYGNEVKALYNALIQEDYPKEALHYYPEDEKIDLIATLKEELKPKDQVLVKASHGMGLIDVVEALKKKEEN